MVPCNSDGVVIFGCVFAWGVCALFGQEHLPDAYFRIVWCIFRRHVDFQDILPRKRGFVTKRSTKSQIAWNHDFRRGGGPGRTFQCRQRSKKNTIWLLESTRFTETLKVFDQGRFSNWKEEQERRLIWCRFSSSLHLRAKSQRAQHIIFATFRRLFWTLRTDCCSMFSAHLNKRYSLSPKLLQLCSHFELLVETLLSTN